MDKETCMQPWAPLPLGLRSRLIMISPGSGATAMLASGWEPTLLSSSLCVFFWRGVEDRKGLILHPLHVSLHPFARNQPIVSECDLDSVLSVYAWGLCAFE